MVWHFPDEAIYKMTGEEMRELGFQQTLDAVWPGWIPDRDDSALSSDCYAFEV